MPEQEAHQALARLAQRLHHVRPCPDQATHSFVLRIRHPDRRQLAGPVQAGQRRRVPPVGLDPLARLARDEARRDHDAVVAPVAEVPVRPIATGAGLISEAQRPASPAEPGRQLVQGRRFVGDLADEPHLAVAARLGHADGDRRLVHVQPDEGGTLSHGPSPVLRQGAGPPGATLGNPAQFEAGRPASDGHLV